MKAFVHDTYGPPETLRLQEVDVPTPNENQLLVRVRAASVNPLDCHMLTGVPYIARNGNGWRRPRAGLIGTDMAGRVEAVGANVAGFQAGDEVFGTRSGAFAEYVAVRADRVVAKPAHVSYAQAAAVPVAALTALQGLRDKGRIAAGQNVLVNGASGGVGTFAVQLAKHFGAEVTAVCRPHNADAARTLGADHVVDYTSEDFTRLGRRYDLILDVVGNRSIADRRRAMAPGATLVIVSGPKGGRWIGPAAPLVRAVVASRFSRTRMVPIMTKLDHDDLAELRDLLADGRLTPVIERTYPLAEVPDALRYVGAGHARGKVVITL